METKYISWECRCGSVYALELKVPTTLWKIHPDRSKCKKKIGKDRECGAEFPDQAERDELLKSQTIITEEK
jgi:hypothetical protein